jgi:hypothetical protein
MLLTVKYVDGLPLARFENVLARHGVPVPRASVWRVGDWRGPFAAAFAQSDARYADRWPLPASRRDGGTGAQGGREDPDFDPFMWVQPKGKRGCALIGKLYGFEREQKTADDATRYRDRQTQSIPALTTLHDWLIKTLPSVAPKSALGIALAYLQKYWDRLVRYMERGYLPINNNRCENAIRPFVVGRKGWLFSDTPRCPRQCSHLLAGTNRQSQWLRALYLAPTRVV